MSLSSFRGLMYDGPDAPSPLPHGITIRTPSPVQCLSTVTTRASQPTGEVLPEHSEHIKDFIPRPNSAMAQTSQIAIVDDASGFLARYAVSVYQDCAATIPWLDLYQALHCKRFMIFFFPQAMNSILTRTNILQTCSRTPFRLGGLMMTCCRRCKIS